MVETFSFDLPDGRLDLAFGEAATKAFVVALPDGPLTWSLGGGATDGEQDRAAPLSGERRTFGQLEEGCVLGDKAGRDREQGPQVSASI